MWASDAKAGNDVLTSWAGVGEQDDVCLTAECVSLAAEVINALDTEVDPCDDFYHFASKST